MIVIVVVASLVVFAWVNGYMGFATNKMGKAIVIQSAAVEPNSNQLVVYIQNVGQGSVRLDSSSVYVEDEIKTISIHGGSMPYTLGEGDTVEVKTSQQVNSLSEKVHVKVTTLDGVSAEASFTVATLSSSSEHKKIVYVVIGVDTEMWDSHDVYLGLNDPNDPKHTDPTPKMDARDYSTTDPSTIAAVYNNEFRGSHLDDFGNTFKMTWFAEMDYLLSQGEWVWQDGTTAGVSGYTSVYDLLMNNFGGKIALYGDAIEWHHHFEVYENGQWQFYWQDIDNNYQYQMDALDHMILDRQFYPSVWRTGWNLMSPGLSNWLDQYIPFEFTSPDGNWYPYQPSDAAHWAVTTYYHGQNANDAFLYAQQNGAAIYSIYCHDTDDMTSTIDLTQSILKDAQSYYPDVSFKYVTAKEAVQSALGYTDRSAPVFTLIKNQDGSYTARSNEAIWENNLYVALKYTDNTYVHIKPTSTGSNTWEFASLGDIVTKENVANLAQDTAYTISAVTASSFTPGNEPIFAVDGIDTVMSSWKSSSVCPQWLQLDLGSIKDFGSIRTHFYDYEECTYKYRIETSNNAQTWQTIVNEKNGRGVEWDSFQTQHARYVRIIVTDSSLDSLANIIEVRVGATQLAVTASSYYEGYPPDLAVDGVGYTYWGTSDLVPEGRLPQWLQVDLGSPISISEIETEFYHDATPRTYTYHIDVSNNGQSWTPVVSSKTGSGDVIDEFPEITARYVRVTITGNTVNNAAHIMELKVFHVTTIHPQLSKIGIAACDLKGNAGVLVTNVP
jgi:hypothetical protein